MDRVSRRTCVGDRWYRGSTWRWHCAGAGGATSVAMAVTVATNAHAGRGDKRPGRGFRGRMRFVSECKKGD